jgi:hypothetical protein
MKNWWARLVGVVCVVACATVAAVSVSPDAGRVLTEDRNHDGRPDTWRHYDASGRLTEVARDSNFDGHSDIDEFYDSRGAILRRESDRNFNGQVDLVEEFDSATHEHVRSVVDVDYDGNADLLVLFRDGQPVFSKLAGPATSFGPRRSLADPRGHIIRHDTAESLAPMTDPFQSDTTVRVTIAASGSNGYVGLSTSVAGLPRPREEAASPVLTTARALPASVVSRSSVPLSPRSPRGPPPSQ